jgi:hypothetical protein
MTEFIIWIVFGALANVVIGLFDVFVVTEPSFLGPNGRRRYGDRVFPKQRTSA